MKLKTPKDENGNQTPLTVNFVKSTMTRATQTANIILKHFPEVTEHQSCDLIREGAPCPPDPPFPEWDPTPSVSFFFYLLKWTYVCNLTTRHHMR